LVAENKVFVTAHSEDFMILSCVDLTQYMVVKQNTDKQTDTSTTVKTC